jgi:hypothetical protein
MAQFRKDTHQYLADGKTIFEVVMLSDQYGNLVGPSNPAGMAVDAFGRARSSEPLTLFDSSFRFGDNGKFATANSASGTSTAFSANTSTIDLTIDTTDQAFVFRESTKVFSYQPGMSLQILNSFVMNSAKTGLVQRVGYFGDNNGFFVERNGSAASFVKRSKVTGTVVDTPVSQSSWNIDKMDGTGPSLLTLNLDDPQIMFIDIEWLGVGSVRMGFVINGQLIWCHSFHHANIDAAAKGAYMQTASLPVRYEIKNSSTTASSSTLKQICTAVVSEGGYELSGVPKSFGIEPVSGSQFRLTTPGTYYPVMSFRLHADKLDSIVVPTSISTVPINNGFYRYKLLYNPTISGAVWANTHSANTSLQYNSNTSATISGGIEIAAGYMTATTQASSPFVLEDGMFKYQFERNGLAGTAIPLVLAVTSDTATVNVIASMVWEEITQ